jgi:cytochrome c553
MSASSTAQPGATTTVDGTEPANAETSVTGVPCDVAGVLARACASCHGEPLSGGAPNHIASYEDLVAPSISDPNVSVAKLSIARMHDTKQPMPPDGGLAADAATLEAWVAAGMPKGTCDTAVTVGPGGNDPTYATASVCTSNRTWTRGDHGSSAMHPGVACIECHDSSDEGPSYSVAGTVYPSAHEPDDCNGSPSGSATVVITDATGKTFSLPVSAAGNFFLRTRIAMPYRAKVVSGSKVRAMSAAQTDGDCNGCHSHDGDAVTKTPGRVMAP